MAVNISRRTCASGFVSRIGIFFVGFFTWLTVFNSLTQAVNFFLNFFTGIFISSFCLFFGRSRNSKVIMAFISDPCMQPLIPPPPGKTPNLVNPQSFLPIGLGVAVPLLFFAWTFVGLRAVGSLKKAHRLYLDDCKLRSKQSISFGLVPESTMKPRF